MISKREHLKTRLKLKVSLLKAVLESAGDGLVVFDLRGKIIHFNQPFCDLWRIPNSIYKKADRRSVLAHVRKQLKDSKKLKPKKKFCSKNENSLEVLELKDGRIFEHSSRPIQIDNEFSGRVWSFRDVTERENAINELRTTQKCLEGEVKKGADEIAVTNLFINSILENIPDMIFVKEAKDLRFVRFNKAGEDLLGHSREVLIGKNDYDFFPKSEADFFTQMDRKVLESGKLHDILEEKIHTLHKGTRILHTKKIPVYEDSKPKYLLGISEDITERKRAEENRIQFYREQLARAEAERGIMLRDDFISIASHELRTPLTALSMQVQLVTRLIESGDLSGPKMERAHQLLRVCQNQLERFSYRVNGLLDVSKMTSGQLKLDYEKMDFIQLLESTLNSLLPELTQKGCTLQKNLSGPITGSWDRFRIEQVIVNLVSNAMKYGARKPIVITVTKEGNSIHFSVQDFGIGIAKKDQRKIFNRFERAVSIRHFGGLGLGLYIVHQIVQSHGGWIKVESEPEKGARFTVVLPLNPALQKTPQNTAEQAS